MARDSRQAAGRGETQRGRKTAGRGETQRERKTAQAEAEWQRTRVQQERDSGVHREDWEEPPHTLVAQGLPYTGQAQPPASGMLIPTLLLPGSRAVSGETCGGPLSFTPGIFCTHPLTVAYKSWFKVQV